MFARLMEAGASSVSHRDLFHVHAVKRKAQQYDAGKRLSD